VQEELSQTSGGVTVKRRTPGVLEWRNIQLKRTTPSDLVVVSWRKAIEIGNLDSGVRDGAIVMVNAESGEPLARWEFHNAWVASLVFDGSVEELTIVHERLERAATPSDKPLPQTR
jgi:phage tail-like protein